jgi:hypothetical protein
MSMNQNQRRLNKLSPVSSPHRSLQPRTRFAGKPLEASKTGSKPAEQGISHASTASTSWVIPSRLPAYMAFCRFCESL